MGYSYPVKRKLDAEVAEILLYLVPIEVPGDPLPPSFPPPLKLSL